MADSHITEPRHGASRAFELEACFPHRICINLARRPDRWTRVQAQFRQHQIEVSRWNAVDGAAVQVPPQWRYSSGAYGCTVSHLDAVRHARTNNYESLIIFEDDVELHSKFRVLFSEFMAQLPARWDGLYFGGIHRSDPEFLAENVVRLRETNSTYAYILRNQVFDAFIALNEKLQSPVDETMKVLQAEFNFYCFLPHLAWVARDYSDVLGAEVNHWWLQGGFVLDGTKIEAQANETGGLILPSRQPIRFRRDVLELILPPICSVLPEVIIMASSADRDALAAMQMPDNCRIICCGQEPVSYDPWDLVRDSVGWFRSDCRYIFACAADTYISNWELLAALHQCHNHDLVIPGEAPVDLTAEDTRKALGQGAEKVDTRFYPRHPSSEPLSGLFIASRGSLTGEPQRSKAFRYPSRPLRLLMQ